MDETWARWRRRWPAASRPRGRSFARRYPDLRAAKQVKGQLVHTEPLVGRAIISRPWGSISLPAQASFRLSPGNIRHSEPSSSSTMWLSECDRIFIANYGSTKRSLLAGRLGVRVVGIGFIGFVMADHAASRSAQFSVTGDVAGNAADDSALDASFCIGAGDRRYRDSSYASRRKSTSWGVLQFRRTIRSGKDGSGGAFRLQFDRGRLLPGCSGRSLSPRPVSRRRCSGRKCG